MAVIKPFCAYRPLKKYAKEIAALPYDVYSAEEARKEARKTPLSFIHIDCGETNFSRKTDPHDPKAYKRAAEVFSEWKAKGYLRQDKKPCYYVYELTMDGRRQRGLVACSSVDDYLNDVILKHEDTRAEKEADRIRHVDTLSAQTGPIFLAYRDAAAIDRVLNAETEKRPAYDFTEPDGIRHTVWVIDDDAVVKKITRLFRKVPHTFIADGHHRCASAVRVALKRREQFPGYTGKEEFNYFLSVLFPESELRIMDYNRVVKDLNGLSKEGFLSKIASSFRIEPVSKKGAPYRPEKPHEFGMYLDGEWYRLTYRKPIRSKDPVRALDVSLLQENLLAPVLGILDPRTDPRIDFVGGIRGLGELERRVDGGFTVAFSMYPTSMGELFSVAEEKKRMPPKSTWFEPKLRSGIFIHEIEKPAEEG